MGEPICPLFQLMVYRLMLLPIGVLQSCPRAGAIKQSAWTLTSTAVSLVDWPLRRLSGGKLLQGVRLVASSPLTYDAELARALWDASADVAGVPRECRVAAADKLAAVVVQGS